MFQLDSITSDLIKKACKCKKHIKLTVGFIKDSNAIIKTFNETGEIELENNTYEIGSVTKTFTASLMSKYIHDGKMVLNNSIQEYIAELDVGKYYPTLRRLATHTAGYSPVYPLSGLQFLNLVVDVIFGRNQHINPLCMDKNRMISLIQKNKLKDIDYKWAYSNFGLSLLGYAIGTISGKGYWDTMNDFLSNELCLKHAYLGASSAESVKGYNGQNVNCGNWQWDKDNLLAPAGAINLTAEDLLTYAKINMNEEKPYLNLCHQKHAHGPKNYIMGLGWWLRKGNNNIIEHDGGTGCFSAYLVIDKSKKVASIVLSNYRLSSNLVQKIGNSILKNLEKIMNKNITGGCNNK